MSTYEEVCFSETFPEECVDVERSLSKLIFNSEAMENGSPCTVEEMLAAVPEDMMQYLIRTLNQQWAVVTFYYHGGATEFTVNFDKTELWEQEKSIMDALYNNISVIRDPYIVVRKGKASIVPGSKSYWDE